MQNIHANRTDIRTVMITQPLPTHFFRGTFTTVLAFMDIINTKRLIKDVRDSRDFRTGDRDKMETVLKFLKKNYGDRTGAVHRRRDSPYQVLVSCVLSQRTKDENTEKTSAMLFKLATTPEQMVGLPVAKLEKAIHSSGFYRQKAKNIKALSKILIDEYDGKVPSNREQLMELPGVGWKTSAVVLSYSFNSDIIPVDTHVNRVSKRLGFAAEKDDVEAVREKLERLVSEKLRYHTHLEMIHFGKEICRPINPLCTQCELLKICPFGQDRVNRKRCSGI